MTPTTKMQKAEVEGIFSVRWRPNSQIDIKCEIIRDFQNRNAKWAVWYIDMADSQKKDLDTNID